MVESGGETRGSTAWFWTVETVDLGRSVAALEDEVRALWADTEANRTYIEALRRGRDDVRRRRLSALRLLGHTLRDVGKAPRFESLARTEHGKPFLIDREGLLDVSLSHSDGYAACGVMLGSGRIGVDVEEYRRITDRQAGHMMERFFSEAERAVTAPTAQAFARTWTLREAVCKLDGRGDPLRVDTSVLPDHLWRYARPLDGGFLTVAVDIGVNV